jgi:hypothetical protein
MGFLLRDFGVTRNPEENPFVIFVGFVVQSLGFEGQVIR